MVKQWLRIFKFTLKNPYGESIDFREWIDQLVSSK